jgi:hypothetical protein
MQTDVVMVAKVNEKYDRWPKGKLGQPYQETLTSYFSSHSKKNHLSPPTRSPSPTEPNRTPLRPRPN